MDSLNFLSVESISECDLDHSWPEASIEKEVKRGQHTETKRVVLTARASKIGREISARRRVVTDNRCVLQQTHLMDSN